MPSGAEASRGGAVARSSERAARPGTKGVSLTEILIVAALASVLGAMAVPWVAGQFRAQQVRSAAFAMRTLLYRARTAAANRAANVAVVFDPPSTGPGGLLNSVLSQGSPQVALYQDTNHNGVRRAEIAAGTERLLENPWRLEDRFPGVQWGAPGDGRLGGDLPGIAVGGAGMVSFSPLGESGSGRITLSGEGVAYAVVIHGANSRIRVERRVGDAWVQE